VGGSERTPLTPATRRGFIGIQATLPIFSGGALEAKLSRYASRSESSMSELMLGSVTVFARVHSRKRSGVSLDAVEPRRVAVLRACALTPPTAAELIEAMATAASLGW